MLELLLQKKHEDAEHYYKQALLEAKKEFGEEDPHVCVACINMAHHYRLTKQWQLSRQMYDEVYLDSAKHLSCCCICSAYHQVLRSDASITAIGTMHLQCLRPGLADLEVTTSSRSYAWQQQLSCNFAHAICQLVSDS